VPKTLILPSPLHRQGWIPRELRDKWKRKEGRGRKKKKNHGVLLLLVVRNNQHAPLNILSHERLPTCLPAMGALSFLRDVYDLDTLDTRFTNSSSTPYNTVIESRGDAAASKERASRFSGKAEPSRWRTPEFFFYYLVFIICVPLMFWTAYTASSRMAGHQPLRSGKNVQI
jgi:hypothetical protein